MLTFGSWVDTSPPHSPSLDRAGYLIEKFSSPASVTGRQAATPDGSVSRVVKILRRELALHTVSAS